MGSPYLVRIIAGRYQSVGSGWLWLRKNPSPDWVGNVMIRKMPGLCVFLLGVRPVMAIQSGLS
jgi:hypothetical protein